ncbi:8-oxoguanine glycosylase ogg1 [Phytophthora boehmeriae]|uniref:8-oxoguanine glycosylase ogg1 n=1 Tax=Phytophthora boehmeriae TaxID=109152 RepID=A0A8T1WNM4_9STRA|nr:8-oxoguanine glycosylase ogg1 [Phytophthora boehmeriae]
MKFISTLVLFLIAISSANAALRSRKLQTYSQTSDYIGLMLDRVNDERAAQGLAALCLNSKLQEAAQSHSDDQAVNDFMSHTGSDDSTMSQRVDNAGYDWNGVAENVAAGQVDVAEVMDAWMNSEGHRHNILGDYTMLGAAYAYNGDGRYKHYWTQDFGKSDTEQCDDGSSVTSTTNSTVSTGSGSGDNVMAAPTRRTGWGGDTSTASTTALALQLMNVAILVTAVMATW